MNADDAKSESTGKTSVDCPLSGREQTRNIILYAAINSLVYLAAPVLYVGLVQAVLLEKLGADKTTANLPASLALWMQPVPVLIAWFIPQVRHLKTVIVAGYSVDTVVAALVVLALLLPSPDWVIPAVLLHAGSRGAVGGTVSAFMWEVLGRGVSQSRRGRAFSLTFGAGPILAVVGSLGVQMILEGRYQLNLFSHVDFRGDFALLYGASVPITALAAILATKMVVPQPAVELVRKPFFHGVFGGFGDFLRTRWIAVTIVAYLLVYAGYSIMPTITLSTNTATGVAAQDLVGYQNALRFGGKVIAGFFLGWLLTRTHPKANLLVTAILVLVGVLWALAVPGKWFLLSFGILGAGELFGAYFPNYILCCSVTAKMRRNLAFSSLIIMPVGFAPLLYGRIADFFGSIGDERLGFQMSFSAAIPLLVVAIALVLFRLPRHPMPGRC